MLPRTLNTDWINELGGVEGLRTILDDFYTRLIADTMVGFFFADKDKATLVQRQLEFTARAFGVEIEYQGKSIPDAHAPLTILPGHFDRRHQLLKETLTAHGLPDAVIQSWLNFDRSFRDVVLRASQNR